MNEKAQKSHEEHIDALAKILVPAGVVLCGVIILSGLGDFIESQNNKKQIRESTEAAMAQKIEIVDVVRYDIDEKYASYGIFGFDVAEVVIQDGCHYLIKHGGMTHMGDCPNPEHDEVREQLAKFVQETLARNEEIGRKMKELKECFADIGMNASSMMHDLESTKRELEASREENRMLREKLDDQSN